MYTSSKKNLIMKIDSNHPTQDMYVKIIILSCYNSGFIKNSFIVCQNKNACTYHLIIHLENMMLDATKLVQWYEHVCNEFVKYCSPLHCIEYVKYH